jgi:hypothetical protein
VSSTKYVEYADRGFWAYDVALEIFLKHLIDAAEASDQAQTEWLSTAIDSWRLSYIHLALELDPGWSAAQRQTFIALADEASARLAKRASIPAEEIVSWCVLDDLRLDTRGAKEVLTAPVVELGRAIIALVSGELPEAPNGTAWFYGTPEGRQTIGMRSS